MGRTHLIGITSTTHTLTSTWVDIIQANIEEDLENLFYCNHSEAPFPLVIDKLNYVNVLEFSIQLSWELWNPSGLEFYKDIKLLTWRRISTI